MIQTFGRCADSPLQASAPKFVFGQTRYFSLCADAPWWKWVLSVRTAADAGAGTDADIRLAGLTCGTFSALGNPVSLTSRCNAQLDEMAPSCFEL